MNSTDGFADVQAAALRDSGAVVLIELRKSSQGKVPFFPSSPGFGLVSAYFPRAQTLLIRNPET